MNEGIQTTALGVVVSLEHTLHCNQKWYEERNRQTMKERGGWREGPKKKKKKRKQKKGEMLSII